MAVVSVSMPDSLLERLDEFIREHGYSGRSEAVREGARGLLEEFDAAELGRQRVVCVATTVFDHDTGAEATLSELRHRYEDLVTSTVHSHVGDACLELFVVEGAVDEVRSFVSRLRAVDGVTSVDRLIVSSDRPALA